jgi:FkbM family methyltransferase
LSLIASLRGLRHGPLKALGPAWTVMGNAYRAGLRAAGASRPVPHKIGPYGPFLLHGEFAFSDFEHWGGGHNRGFERSIEASRGKRCVLDVGAHFGLVAMPMSRAVAPDGHVYAFEPAAANIERLKEHLTFNDIRNVTVVEALVGAEDKSGVAFFEERRASGKNSVTVKRDHESYVATQRPQVTIDSFCRARGLSPDVIKIDVEGAELGVLEGGRETLTRCRPAIFLSVHPAQIALLGRSADELSRLIDDLGYQCRDVEGQPVSAFRLDEYVLTAKGT